MSSDQIANYAGLNDVADLKTHVDNILVERVPDTPGNRRVREVRRLLQILAWSEDSFLSNYK